MKRIISILFCTLAIQLILNSQNRISNTVEFDKLVYDFGDVLITDGPLTCTFTVKNISEKPIAIYQVASSCGCTGVKWTKEPISPGKTGKITATYTNDEGPYLFDKALTIYISSLKRPVILRLKGIAKEKKQTIQEIYNYPIGALGFRETTIKAMNMTQGEERSAEISFANLSKNSVNITFITNKGIKAIAKPNPIPSQSTGKIIYTITTDREHWGKNTYSIHPVINGKQQSQSIDFQTFIKEDFSNLNEEQIKNSANPIFKSSTFSFGKIRAGELIEATFKYENVGKSEFQIYKIDIDYQSATAKAETSVKPKEIGIINVKADSAKMPKGEGLIIVTLTTNSPLRPIINLFIAGWID